MCATWGVRTKNRGDSYIYYGQICPFTVIRHARAAGRSRTARGSPQGLSVAARQVRGTVIQPWRQRAGKGGQTDVDLSHLNLTTEVR